ncbi:flagellar biosynthesis protein FlhF [Desulfotalea psychrophila]|uniref:Flagellar biosynthesis protein FlhF n=1 Tax=Desulfotalea psychrophila (strain LSv54 / DSM 12343) TaxID=177439 RepID=Q6AJS5_DESPS|nr:flagellar biosynthesis protein FlhF [Desulfotalea psychrophila]CAG37405.1 related to flagellar biosynthesis protein (FlhF) [Desulfotalea psychrophila LSv54]
MQFKVFEAKDMKTGLRRIKEELGPDALIISTRTIKNGKLGLLSKSTLEITASIDSTPVSSLANRQSRRAVPPARAPQEYRPTIHHVADDPVELPPFSDSAPVPEIFSTPEKAEKAEKESSPKRDDSATEEKFMAEMDDLKNLVRNLAGEVGKLQSREPEGKTTHLQASNHPLYGNPAFNMLCARGVSEELATDITLCCQKNFDSKEIHDAESILSQLKQHIKGKIEVNPLLKEINEQQCIALVGPTGVGKTTTLAKLAAAKLSSGSASIAMITIDTYRIAAVEQLKVYGEIMNIPVDVVITPEQLESSLLRHRDCELILIDTAGRSPKDDFSIDELANFLRPEFNIEKHLVLSTTSRESELAETIRQFGRLGIDSTVYTKIDECSQLGVILNTQLHNKTPISYMTNGQRVPEDFIDISPKCIAELIMSTN